MAGKEATYSELFVPGYISELQQQTFLYEGVFGTIGLGSYDRGYVDFSEQAPDYEDIDSKFQTLADNEFETYRRQISKRNRGTSFTWSKIELGRMLQSPEETGTAQLNQVAAMRRAKNKFVAERIFGTGQEIAGDETLTSVTWPTSATYVVEADLSNGNGALTGFQGFDTTGTGLHYDKILYGLQLLEQEHEMDPDVYGAMNRYVIGNRTDFISLMNSKDSNGERVYLGDEYKGLMQQATPEGLGTLRSSRVQFPDFTFIIDNKFHDYTINTKTAGLGSTTLTNGRKLPMFVGENFRYHEMETEAPDIVRSDNHYSKYTFRHTMELGFSRVREKGMVEIEVATAVS